jgi:hypothetical protein
VTAVWIPAIRECQEVFSRLLYVSCYYPTTPTDYPSATRGTSVGPPVAVNIDICGYLRFLSITLSELYGYSTPLRTFLIKKEFSLHMPVFIFQPTVNSGAGIIVASSVRTLLVICKKCAVTKGLHILYIDGCGRVKAVERVHSGSCVKDVQWSCSKASHRN